MFRNLIGAAGVALVLAASVAPHRPPIDDPHPWGEPIQDVERPHRA